jgi:hypothetical protein
VELAEELSRVAEAALALAGEGEELSGIVPTEPREGVHVFVCSYGDEGARSWLALHADGGAVEERALLREAVSIAALCELAEESAGGGKLDELRAQLVALRITENPEGIDEAEEAIGALERTIAAGPRLASPAYLDAIGAAARRLEAALGGGGPSPFAEAMKQGVGVADELVREVEAGYKRPLDGGGEPL